MGIMLVSLGHPSKEFSRVIVLTACLPHAALKPDRASGASFAQVLGSLLKVPRQARSSRGGVQKAGCGQDGYDRKPCVTSPDSPDAGLPARVHRLAPPPSRR